MDEKVLMAALAGLLHDVGKFAKRAGKKLEQEFSNEDVNSLDYHELLTQQFITEYVPPHLHNGLMSYVSDHLGLHDIVRRSEKLVANNCRPNRQENNIKKNAGLVPVLTSISLKAKAPIGLSHELTALDVFSKATYPTANPGEDYSGLWEKMTGELQAWKMQSGKNWDGQSLDDYFITLLAVLQKYLWCIPSATDNQKNENGKESCFFPDVSIYDQSRLVSAIAACLAFQEADLPDEKGSQPVAFLVRGDFSGIQNFIYRISRPDSETAHIAKRLRGRSFYVQLLTEVVADWLLREVGLPSVCALYVGGGRFDLLLPLSAQEKLDALKKQLEDWLLREFSGEIAILMAVETVFPNDFSDTRQISQKLNAQLDNLKRQKWLSHFSEEKFFEPGGEQWHVCKVCQLTPMRESGICPSCSQQENIGTHLPHARYLGFCYQGEPIWQAEQIIRFPNSPFALQIVIVRKDDDIKKLLASKCRVVLYSINETREFIQPGVASAFRFLANSAPKALEKLYIGDEPPIEKSEVLHFEAISALSKGAQRLGVLKADVDWLGLVLSEGLADDDPIKQEDQRLLPTLSRVATLSRMLDVFFAGVLNRICREVFEAWQRETKNELAGKTDGLFYVMYSGGDDLFIVGPWDQVLVLALRIRQEFQSFAGGNPNLSLSAGYVQVKPRYPVQKFAELVDDAEKLAKKERNSFAAFGESMIWTEVDAKKIGQEYVSFEWLLEQANIWTESIEKNDLPRGLIYDLGGLFRKHRSRDGRLRPTWTPQLYYTLARRLKPEMRQKHQENILRVIASRKPLVPVSITSLSIRERRE